MAANNREQDQQGQAIYCGQCGQRNPLGNIFCGRCGRPLHPGPDFPHVAGVPPMNRATNRQRGAQLMAIGCLVMVGAVVALAVLLLVVGVL